MISDSVVIGAFLVIAALFLFSVWGQLAFADYPMMPSPFSINMDGAKEHSRFFHVWLTPLVAIGMMAFTGYLLGGLPRYDETYEKIRSMLDMWAILTIAAFAVLHGFTLWRLNRWVQSQP